jgi:hypothetical protein
MKRGCNYFWGMGLGVRDPDVLFSILFLSITSLCSSNSFQIMQIDFKKLKIWVYAEELKQ